MTFTPIRIGPTPGVGNHRARALIISVLLGVSGCLAAAGSQAEDCWREPVNASWSFAELNFAIWGDTNHHQLIAVDGDVVYFLEMSTHPSLLYYDTRDDARGRLEDFPGSDQPTSPLATRGREPVGCLSAPERSRALEPSRIKKTTS